MSVKFFYIFRRYFHQWNIQLHKVKSKNSGDSSRPTKKYGFSVVHEIGGHGVGLAMHEDPFIYHFGKKGTGMVLFPGMVFTIEPMVNEGTFKLIPKSKLIF